MLYDISEIFVYCNKADLLGRKKFDSYSIVAEDWIDRTEKLFLGKDDQLCFFTVF
jgi:hypothetical protein